MKAGLDRSSPWYPFVENWAGEAFAGYIAYLGSELDALAAETGADELIVVHGASSVEARLRSVDLLADIGGLVPA